jgi:hypothetical protein
MKKILFASFAFAFALTAQAQKTPSKTQPKTTKTAPKPSAKQEAKPDLYVIAKSGLKLRDAANLNAKALATIAYGAKVQWLSTDYKKKVKVENTEGYMAKVKADGKEGFMFDGFLAVNSPLAPLVISKPMAIIKDPDELQTSEMVGTMKPEDLAEVGSDIGYYAMIAGDVLKKYKISYQSTQMRFIQFVKKDGSKELIDTKSAEWREHDCILFNGTALKKAAAIDLQMGEDNKKPPILDFMK